MTNDILYFHPKDDYTGSTRVLNDILENKACTSSVITTGKNGLLSNNKNCKVYSVPYFYYYGNNNILKLLNFPLGLLNNILLLIVSISVGFRYKTFYINTIVPFIPIWVGKFLRKKIIWHIHEKMNGGWAFLSLKISEYTFKHTNCKKIYVSNYTMNQYDNLNNSQGEVIYNTLSKEFKKNVKFKPIEKRELKEILLMSSLTIGKGYHNFIKIAALLPEYNFTLVLSGTDAEVKAVLPKELPSNIKIYPVQKDVHSFYYNADLVMNLSIPELWIETFGLTLIEAMAYGIPVIAPNIGGPTEFIENDVNGFCVNTNNIDEIINKIKYILSYPIYRRLAHGALLTAAKF